MSDIQVGILAIEPGIQLLPPGPAVDALGQLPALRAPTIPNSHRRRYGAAAWPCLGLPGASRLRARPPVYGTMSTLAVPSALNRNLYLRECP